MIAKAWMAVERLGRSPFGPPAVFLALSIVLYGSTLFGDFVFDDRFFTTRGDMRAWAYLSNVWLEPSLKQMAAYPHYRPITFATLSLNFLLFGESPVSFHAVSVLLNAAVCWLLFLLVRRLFSHLSLAWMVALFFALLPIHSESVAYIKARDELLVAFFGLLAWLSFLRAMSDPVRQRVLWSTIAGVCSLGAFLSKESAIVLPGVMGGVLLLLHGWRSVMRTWLPLALQVAAMVTFFVLKGLAAGWQTIPGEELLYFGQNPLGYAGPESIPWTAATLFFIAVAKTFFPWNLSATYGFNHVPLIDSPLDSWMAPAGVVILLCLIALIAGRRTRTTPLGIGALAFLVLYFPFSKIPLVTTIDLFAERWLYAPSIGLAMIGGYVAWIAWKRYGQIPLVLFMAVAAAYLFVLVPRVAVWRNETLLGESMVRDAPDAVTSYVFLVQNRMQNGRLDEAVDLVGKGLDITRNHMPLHHVAVMVALDMQRVDLAEQALAAAEDIDHELLNDLLRAEILARQQRFQESLDTIKGSRWFSEDDYRIRMLLALNLWRLGRREEAEQYFDWDSFIPSLRMTREEKIRVFESY